LRSNSTFLTLLVSFCLSTGSYVLAQPDVVPVQEMVFDDFVIEGHIQTIEFDDYVINIVRDEERSDVIVMDELIVVSQVDPSDDGDGENIDFMNDNWCQIWPDHEVCVNIVEGGETSGGDDEEGC
jgi:hypothetical protein